jgi:hypothetical protein
MKPLLRPFAPVALLAAAACRHEAPPTEQPPVPKAAAEQHTELRDAIKAPQDKAKAVEATVQDAAEKQRQQEAAQEQ